MHLRISRDHRVNIHTDRGANKEDAEIKSHDGGGVMMKCKALKKINIHPIENNLDSLRLRLVWCGQLILQGLCIIANPAYMGRGSGEILLILVHSLLSIAS